MNINLRADERSMRELNLALNRLAESTGKTLKEVLPSQMRLLATDLAFVTYPKGKGTKDNADHQKKIKGRIAEVYPHIGTIVNQLKEIEPKVVGRFTKYMASRQYGQAKLILDKYMPNMNITIGAFDGGALHKEQMNKRRVARRHLTTGYNRVEAYANKIVKRSGFAKGGFATASRQLGGVRGIPGFATRQNAPGSGSITGDGKTLTVTIVNGVNHLKYALKPRDESFAVSNRQKNVTILLDRIQTNKIKKLMRR